MKINILLFAIISILFSSCYKHEDINAKLGEPRYKLEKGTPIDDAIYDYYQKYSRFVVYNYKPLDYQWNISSRYSHEFVPVFNYNLKEDLQNELNEEKDILVEMENGTVNEEQLNAQKEKVNTLQEQVDNFDSPENQDKRKELESLKKDTLMMGYNVLKKVFIDLYNDEFKQKYFPFRIFLAHTLNYSESSRFRRDQISYYGQSFLAMGKIRKGINELTGEELNEFKGAINAKFWGGYLNINNKYKIPESFFEVSSKFYKINLRNLEENVGKKNIDISYYTYGFCEADRKGLGEVENKYKMGPDQDQDIEDTMKAIVSLSKTELDNAMESHPLLRQKYDILVSYFKEQLGIDITKIAEVDFTKENN